MLLHSTGGAEAGEEPAIVSTSRIRGTLRQDDRLGRQDRRREDRSAPFLLPAARTVPLSGRPPSITKDCMRAAPYRASWR